MHDPLFLRNVALVFFFAFAMLWVAVPLGLTLGLPPLLVAVIAVPCSITGAALVIWLIRPFSDFVHKHLSERDRRGRVKLIFRVWRRSGIPGLGVLGPLLVGPPLTIAVGMLLGALPKRLIAWTSLGIVIWTSFMLGLWYFGREWFKFIT